MRTPTRWARRLALPVIIALLAGLPPAAALAYDDNAYADHAFQRTWDRHDRPVEAGQVQRTWMWGLPVSGEVHEAYADSPGGMRVVQYFDKSRMEITNPAAADDGLWYVTNGLLVVELITGTMQRGDASFVQRDPAEVGVAGDPDDTSGPTYAALAGVLDAPPADDGALLTQRIARDGSVTDDPALAAMNVRAAHRVQAPGIDHQIAAPFWDFMNATGVVYTDGGFSIAPLFVNPFYATGYPITEAYWANVTVAGTEQLVLLQCFERRCLTYTPGNDAGWQVEAGNVGQHYFIWRYGRPLFSANLNAQQEVPEVVSPADGSAAFTLSADHQTLHYRVALYAIAGVTAAHIHVAPRGENGDVVAGLYSNPAGAASGGLPLVIVGALTADDLTGPLEGLTLDDLLYEILAGNAYVNVHTSAHPGGETRGQIGLAPTVQLRADLSGDEEVPAVATDARGYAWFQLRGGDDLLDFEVGVEGIEDVTAAHLHLAPAGETGDVVAFLFSGGPTSEDGILAQGTLESDDLLGPLEGLTIADLYWEIIRGNVYVNVHTVAHPGGEIRGQVWFQP